MPNCKQCGTKLSGRYITAMNGSWHPSCFMCTECRKPIASNNFLVFANKPYHENCLKCQGCKRSITGSYIKHNGGAWHSGCYKHQHHPKCSVCKKPLTRRYLADFWGNQYCLSHRNFATCISCGRIVCKNLTSGGMQYPDGLMICTLCGLKGIANHEQANKIMQEMRSALGSVGLMLNSAQVPLKLSGRDELRESSRHNFHDDRPILGLARWSITQAGGRVIARTFKDILIQINLSEEHFRTVAIHELTHAWFFYNNYRDMPLEIEEGMCVLMEYIWLKGRKTMDAKYLLTVISQNQDPIYGLGFRKARNALKLMPLTVLLKYLKEKKKFPTRLAAFFYH